MKCFNFEQSVETRTVTGGTSRKSVEGQIAALMKLVQ